MKKVRVRGFVIVVLALSNVRGDLQAPSPGIPAPVPDPSPDSKTKLSTNDKQKPHGTGGYCGVTAGFSAYLVNIPENTAGSKEMSDVLLNKLGSLAYFVEV